MLHIVIILRLGACRFFFLSLSPIFSYKYLAIIFSVYELLIFNRYLVLFETGVNNRTHRTRTEHYDNDRCIKKILALHALNDFLST